jgi:hypothetical protein
MRAFLRTNILAAFRFRPGKGFRGSWGRGTVLFAVWACSLALFWGAYFLYMDGSRSWDSYKWAIAKTHIARVVAYMVACVVMLGGGALLDSLFFARRPDRAGLIAAAVTWRALPLAAAAAVNLLLLLAIQSWEGVTHSLGLPESVFFVRLAFYLPGAVGSVCLIVNLAALAWGLLRGMGFAVRRLAGLPRVCRMLSQPGPDPAGLGPWHGGIWTSVSLGRLGTLEHRGPVERPARATGLFQREGSGSQ